MGETERDKKDRESEGGKGRGEKKANTERREPRAGEKQEKEEQTTAEHREGCPRKTLDKAGRRRAARGNTGTDKRVAETSRKKEDAREGGEEGKQGGERAGEKKERAEAAKDSQRQEATSNSKRPWTGPDEKPGRPGGGDEREGRGQDARRHRRSAHGKP